MKHFLFLFVFLTVSFLANSQAYYSVNVNNHLNVRKTPDVNSVIIGKLGRNETVKVLEIQGQWAKIEYQGKEAYVNAQYLKFYRDDTASQTSNYTSNRAEQNSETHKIFFWGMIIAAVVCFLLRMTSMWRVNFYVVIFALFCMSEVFYYFGCLLDLWTFMPLSSQYGAMWFCHPRAVGVVWGIAASVVYMFFASSQLMLALNLYEDLFDNEYYTCYIVSIVYVVICNIGTFIIVNDNLAMLFTLTYCLYVLIQSMVVAANRGLLKAVIFFFCIYGTALVFGEISGWIDFLLKYLAT
jgi:hypothetical protein